MWLIFDLGTSGAKAALVRDNGTIAATAVENYPTDTSEGGVVEQNAGDWWRAMVAASRSFGELRADVQAICVTGQMQDLILLDRDGVPVGPVILYSDTRAIPEAAEIIDRVGAGRIQALTGNEQGADSLWAKLLWVQRHQPGVWDSASGILFGAADYAGYRLTGVASTDTTTASTTGLFNLNEQRWFDDALLSEIGVKGVTPLLPTIVSGGAQIGTLRDDAAVEMGVRTGVPVHHGPGDAGSTTIGAGSGEIGRAYGYLGTSGWVGFTANAPGSPDQGVFTLAHPHPNQFMQVAPLLTAGGNLEWIRDLLGHDSFTEAIIEAIERPQMNIIYLPYLNGERAPFVDPFARAAFIGMGPGTQRADLVRAVLEGVAFAYRHVIDTLMQEPLSQLILTGGGTRSIAWCQMFADVLGVPILLIADAQNVTVRGALMSAQVVQGLRVDYALDVRPDTGTTLVPDPAKHDAHTRKYEIYRAAYPALKSLFGMM